MAAGPGAGTRWGGVGLAAPLFRYLLECMTVRAVPKPTLPVKEDERNDHLLGSFSSSSALVLS